MELAFSPHGSAEAQMYYIYTGIRRGFLHQRGCRRCAFTLLCVNQGSVFWFLILCETFLESEPKFSQKSTYACKCGKGSGSDHAEVFLFMKDT